MKKGELNMEAEYEVMLMLYAEGELTPTDRKVVERWLERHPEAAEELAYYAAAPRLQADTTVTYPHKTELEHRVVPLWRSVASFAAAACLAATLMVRPFLGNGVMEQGMVTPTTESGQPAMQVAMAEPVKQVRMKAKAKAKANEAKVEEETVESAPDVVVPEVEEVEPMVEDATADETLFCDNLIEVVPDEVLAYTDDLIDVTVTPRWAERLYAYNDRARERVDETQFGALITKNWPDNERLEADIVAPAEDARLRLREAVPLWMRNTYYLIEEFNNNNKTSL